MPLQATSGAASYDAFGGGVPVVPNYIEDVFSTYLYTGTGASQTITNGIDLSGKGGLVWAKIRNGTGSNRLVDTVRGGGNVLTSNAANANVYDATVVPTFSSSGFDTGGGIDISSYNYVSWTFRKQPKFFDVQTFTGNGTAKTISHNLGSAPACIFVKRLDSSTGGEWYVFHRSLTSPHNKYLWLNSTAAVANYDNLWGPNGYLPTETEFKVGEPNNLSGATYVAYLFAHDAGGFGLTGTDNVISCGTFTDSGADQSINLGYEPQWVLVKRTSSSGDWWLVDNMRGMPVGSVDATLKPNTADAEQNAYSFINPEATGFRWITGQISSSDQTFIYIAIRRPMKVPTSGTSVFTPVAYTGNGTAGRSITAGFPVDLAIGLQRTPANGSDRFFVNRLVGATKGLVSWDTVSEATDANSLTGFDSMTGVTVGTDTTDRGFNGSGRSLSPYFFRRAPSFFEQICYTGTGTGGFYFNHNLTVIPELVIIKIRDGTGNWVVSSRDSQIAAGGVAVQLKLNTTAAAANGAGVDLASATATQFWMNSSSQDINASGWKYVMYLFATCAGVSKVGSYTGTATTKQIDCGFTAGARFVLIKKTSGTGSWYVWDSARGIVSGNDPYLLLNSTAAEVTNTDYIDTYSAGFEISSTAPSEINESGGSFIFLAIA